MRMRSVTRPPFKTVESVAQRAVPDVWSVAGGAVAVDAVCGFDNIKKKQQVFFVGAFEEVERVCLDVGDAKASGHSCPCFAIP